MYLLAAKVLILGALAAIALSFVDPAYLKYAMFLLGCALGMLMGGKS